MSSNLEVGPFSGSYTAVIQDQRTSGTAGDSVTTTISDQQLNTIVRSKPFLTSLSSNEFTLEAGEYELLIQDWISMAGVTLAGVFCITDDSNNILDSTRISASANSSNAYSVLEWRASLSLGSSTALKYRAKGDFGSSTRPAHSLGDEYYQKIYITKVG